MEEIKDPWDSSKKSGSILSDFKFQPTAAGTSFIKSLDEDHPKMMDFFDQSKKMRENIKLVNKNRNQKEPELPIFMSNKEEIFLTLELFNSSNKLKNFQDIKTLPSSIGVEIGNNTMEKMILKGTDLPIKISEIFTTEIEGQEFVNINILEGEAEKASENNTLITLRIDNIPYASKGAPKIELLLDINLKGILKVSAKFINRKYIIDNEIPDILDLFYF